MTHKQNNTQLSGIVLNVVKLNVKMLNVIIMSVIKAIVDATITSPFSETWKKRLGRTG
jgi:hypothetical protein